MKKKNIILFIVTALFGCLVGSFLPINTKRSMGFTKEMFPLWDGSDVLFPPYGSDTVCMIQCESIRPGSKEKKISSQEPIWYCKIKTYSDKYEVQRTLDCLRDPEILTPSIVESEQYLLAVFASHKLNSLSAFRIPFQLDETGYAITPRGKDRTLYKILKNGLEEWHAVLAEEREQDHAQKLLYDYMLSVEKKRRETLSENEYLAKINDPLPFSVDDFRAFLKKNTKTPMQYYRF